MACGVPQLVPRHSAFLEWPQNNVRYLPLADEPFYSTQGLNTKLRIPSYKGIIEALEWSYTHPSELKALGDKGYAHAISNTFNWKNIGEQWMKLF